MEIYENIVILSHNASEDEVRSVNDKVTDIVVSSGGDIIKIDNWGRRRLAYEINKQRIEIYILFLFKAPPTAIAKLEGYFRVSDSVVKSLVIKLGKKEIASLPKEMPEEIPKEMAEEIPKEMVESLETPQEAETDVLPEVKP
ncbi:30S ribosomal protein S6 [Thermodesulfovibrionales bacterium]|nr:30S ribosomal protein S6 [Thermodesulfovibrionales bacterium]